MRTCDKGPIAEFVLFDMGGVDYNINYIKGPMNKIADALSRFPMVTDKTMAQRRKNESAALTDEGANSRVITASWVNNAEWDRAVLATSRSTT